MPRWLRKQGETFPRPWKTRWFYYDSESGYLCYFKDREDRKPIGCVGRRSTALRSPKLIPAAPARRAMNLATMETIRADDTADSGRF
jgi:hypothetical protein